MMTAAEVRDELRVKEAIAAYLQAKIVETRGQIEYIEGLCEVPMPGAIVRDQAGKLFRVVQQGTLKLDTLGDAGLIQPGAWHLYDIMQNGAPDQPWPKE